MEKDPHDHHKTTDPTAGPGTSGDGSGDAAYAPRGTEIGEDAQEDVWALAALARKKGLRFWGTEFEVITRRRMVELGTYVLPYRWAHWTFGREYARMQKLHDLGLVEILEMVLNTRPARAYLLDANSRDDNRMVIAHVFAHVDFFANNMWFERTPDNILREAHHHERRLRELQEEHGRDAVEAVLDRVLSIQWYVDFYRHYEQATPRAGFGGPDHDDQVERADPGAGMTPSDLPMPRRRGPAPHRPPPLDPHGHRDLLEYLIVHAPMSDLEREVMTMIREETLYFYPNALTKIMNEGWATYWHADLLREYLPFSAFDQFAVKHSHLMQSEGLNPYKLGFLVYEDIRRRGDLELGPGGGLRRIFEVRRYGDDVSFIRDHLTQEVVDAAALYLYDEDPETGERTITSTDVDDVKPQILSRLENLGRPHITVDTGDHAERGELLLQHHFDGREIDMDRAGDVLQQVHGFWRRPVHLDTQVGGKAVRLTYDGERARIQDRAGDEDHGGQDDDDQDEGPAGARPLDPTDPGLDPGPPVLDDGAENDPREAGTDTAHDTTDDAQDGTRQGGHPMALGPGQTRLPSGAKRRDAGEGAEISEDISNEEETDTTNRPADDASATS